MPVHKYTPKPAIYDCLQYTGGNYAELAAWAPMTQEGGQAYLIVPNIGNVLVPVGNWVMKDIFDLFMMSDDLFQKGYKREGGRDDADCLSGGGWTRRYRLSLLQCQRDAQRFLDYGWDYS